ncbi:hypothetical protein TELCIR_02994 [Teladorsagia circumcincta]|uniref:Uncharacterized protein n=1 Tax=Teladorsagia circumcincta TaxID=45464 RepID=A0A2G9UXS4_TELCI|nr:hypothetical protein TELCIR_02994 [Teladorsagia circumcincta]
MGLPGPPPPPPAPPPPSGSATAEIQIRSEFRKHGFGYHSTQTYPWIRSFGGSRGGGFAMVKVDLSRKKRKEASMASMSGASGLLLCSALWKCTDHAVELTKSAFGSVTDDL